MPVLIDTGVLLRGFVRDDASCRAIRRAVRRLYESGEPLVTTIQNLAEFWNVCTRPATARGGYGLTGATVDRRVRFIERFCDVLTEDNDAYEHWRTLVTRYNVNGASVHDARLVAVMVTRRIARILTLNPDDFRRYQEVTAVTPGDVLTAPAAEG